MNEDTIADTYVQLAHEHADALIAVGVAQDINHYKPYSDQTLTVHHSVESLISGEIDAEDIKEQVRKIYDSDRVSNLKKAISTDLTAMPLDLAGFAKVVSGLLVSPVYSRRKTEAGLEGLSMPEEIEFGLIQSYARHLEEDDFSKGNLTLGAEGIEFLLSHAHLENYLAVVEDSTKRESIRDYVCAENPYNPLMVLKKVHADIADVSLSNEEKKAWEEISRQEIYLKERAMEPHFNHFSNRNKIPDPNSLPTGYEREVAKDAIIIREAVDSSLLQVSANDFGHYVKNPNIASVIAGHVIFGREKSNVSYYPED